MHVARVQRSADFIQREPSPGEFDVGGVVLVWLMPLTPTSSRLAIGIASEEPPPWSVGMEARTVSTPEGVSIRSQQGGGVKSRGQGTGLAEIHP